VLQTRAAARVTPEIAAEAAVWVTRLHGPQRCRQMEEECLAWQQRSPAHQEAFERCTDTWEEVPRVTVASAFAASTATARRDGDGSRSGALMRWRAAGVLAAVLMVGAVGYQQWRDLGVYATGVGEQRLVVLDDGTRMTLNTATEVRVDLEASRRMVSIRRGEALFEVAKDSSRPFVVRAGGSEVVAIGTVFAVRFTTQGQGAKDALAVTLLEGQVALQAASGERGLAPEQAVRMVAGERVRLSGGGPGSRRPARAEVDRPNVAQLVAWKRSEAVFDGVSLPDAVAEMNRYSRTPIVLLDPSGLAKLQVSGIYRTGDTAGFANAVAALHGLDVREHAGRLELSKPQ
jgi:transmembrane sensor